VCGERLTDKFADIIQKQTPAAAEFQTMAAKQPFMSAQFPDGRACRSPREPINVKRPKCGFILKQWLVLCGRRQVRTAAAGDPAHTI